MSTTSRILFLFVLFLAYVLPSNSDASEQKCVILLHGLARSHTCMASLEAMLKRHHYIVINKDYPSTTKSIKELANYYLPPMINECQKYNPHDINFVTHSMGGIILQEYLQNHQIAKLNRIIMLSPPNHGSRVADILHDNWLYQVITGPAGQELTTWKNSTPNKLHLTQQYKIGVIAGTYNFVPFEYYLFNEENDGAVSVSSAKTTIMQDFITLPVSHSFMMDNNLVHMQILHFLNHGQFIRRGENKLYDNLGYQRNTVNSYFRST